MNDSPLVKMVADRLLEAGYGQLDTPFRIASVDFNFTLAFRGNARRANDLVLIVDTTTGEHGDRDAKRVSQRIAGLGRALDVSQSRLVITAILVGAVSHSSVEDLSENCRVLTVDNISTNHIDEVARQKARRQLDDRISVLLPLTLPESSAVVDDDDQSAIEQLRMAVPAAMDQDFISRVLEASKIGKEAVENSLISSLEGSLEKEESDV
ncbi:hypothetical protein [Thalassovita taeanensis]|jgi:hypothetical protein|uniref:Uncharacterized protein n=1 Tax=Thalassovita taeanensis TaxID=657014 RepID=A0A1H9K8C3_9RHOB|nr:hypothetical protein [Thalassovita taeanensis]SEQ95173.1 hypothetical protein SAMN04488092_11769 [Thalassovita taeanensis]